MSPLGELAEFPLIKELLVQKKDRVSLTGCVDSQKVHMMAGLGERFKCKIIVTFSDLRAKEIAEDKTMVSARRRYKNLFIKISICFLK